MNAPGCIRPCPSHPRVRRMTVSRTLPDGSELCGCLCGFIYTEDPGHSLAVAGRGVPVCKLTALCRGTESILPLDRISVDGEEYSVVCASEAGGGTLTASLRREDTHNR